MVYYNCTMVWNDRWRARAVAQCHRGAVYTVRAAAVATLHAAAADNDGGGGITAIHKPPPLHCKVCCVNAFSLVRLRSSVPHLLAGGVHQSCTRHNCVNFSYVFNAPKPPPLQSPGNVWNNDCYIIIIIIN